VYDYLRYLTETQPETAFAVGTVTYTVVRFGGDKSDITDGLATDVAVLLASRGSQRSL
jgi:hypothetical protein